MFKFFFASLLLHFPIFPLANCLLPTENGCPSGQFKKPAAIPPLAQEHCFGHLNFGHLNLF